MGDSIRDRAHHLAAAGLLRLLAERELFEVPDR
jgi:hypothetical protein